MCGESTGIVKIDAEMLVELFILRSPECKKWFIKISVRTMCVSPSVHIARDQRDGPIFLKFGM